MALFVPFKEAGVVSHVTTSIIEQVRAFFDAGLIRVKVDGFVVSSTSEVRVFTSEGKRKTTYIVKYDRGSDLYDVHQVEHDPETLMPSSVAKLSGVYFDQFPEVIV